MTIIVLSKVEFILGNEIEISWDGMKSNLVISYHWLQLSLKTNHVKKDILCMLLYNIGSMVELWVCAVYKLSDMFVIVIIQHLNIPKQKTSESHTSTITYINSRILTSRYILHS